MENPRWHAVPDLIAQQHRTDDVTFLLNCLLSHDEREAIASRLAVYRALIQAQMSQRQIAAKLGVSIAMITRVSNNLKALSAAERQLLSELLSVTEVNHSESYS